MIYVWYGMVGVVCDLNMYRVVLVIFPYDPDPELHFT